MSPSVSVVGEAAEVSGEVEGHLRGVAAVDADGHGASAHGVQDMHAAAQEFFGQSLAAVIRVCDEFSDECFPGAFVPGTVGVMMAAGRRPSVITRFDWGN